MPWSVEGRVPFVDHILYESIKTYSSRWLIHNGVEKYILREAVRPFVTASVYARQKYPLDAPPVLTGDSRLVRDIGDRIECSEFRSQSFFCVRKVKLLLEQIPKLTLEEKRVWDPVLMMILSTIAIQQLIDSASKGSP